MEKQQLFVGESHAKDYSIYRPDPPEELVQTILKYLKEKVKGELIQAVDVGCGAGQSTIILKPHFKKVLGLDISVAQIEEAKKNRSADNIEYMAHPAEVLPVPDKSTQLITAGTALHWFDLDAFFAEAKRVLVKDGVLASYTTNVIRPLGNDDQQVEQMKQLMDEALDVTLKPYRLPESEIIRHEYQTVVYPFKDVQRVHDIFSIYESNFEAYMGYVTTVSSVQKFLRHDEAKARQFIADYRKRLLEILKLTENDVQAPMKVCAKFALVLCRN